MKLVEGSYEAGCKANSKQTLRQILLAIRAEAEHIDRVTLSEKPTRQLVLSGRDAELVGVDIGNRLAAGAHQVMMRPGIRFHAQRAVMQAHFTENAAVDKEVNIL